MATWNIDQAHSEILFKAKHLMITTVTGRFANYEGTVEAENADLSDLKISFKAEVASISTRNDDRDAHLRSDDFFNAEAYPYLIFNSTSTKSLGDGEYEVLGDMTIRDVTKPVSLKVEVVGITNDPWGNTKAGLTFKGKVNRKDFGLKFHVVNEAGDLLVSDEIRLEGDVQLGKA